MQTIEEIIDRYKTFSNTALVDAHDKLDDYTEIGKEALLIVINSRGGIELMKNETESHREIEAECDRIRHQVLKFLNQNKTISEIFTEIKSDKIQPSNLDQIISKTYQEFESQKSDKEINSGTIVGGFFGALLGGMIGGVIFAVQLVYTGKLYLILMATIPLIGYGCVRLFTKQSRRNSGVLIMTGLSVLLAGLFGGVIYYFIGNLYVR